jgi:hypothetical protein
MLGNDAQLVATLARAWAISRRSHGLATVATTEFELEYPANWPHSRLTNQTWNETLIYQVRGSHARQSVGEFAAFPRSGDRGYESKRNMS